NAGERSAARSPKPPRWSAERRASRVISAFTRVLTRYGTQGASQAPDTPRHGVSNGCRCTRTSLGAPPSLDRGLAKQRCKARAQNRAAGTRWAVLKTMRFAARDVRPHPEERVCRMGAADWNVRTHRSAVLAVEGLGPRGAALLLSMRAGEGGAFRRDGAGSRTRA